MSLLTPGDRANGRNPGEPSTLSESDFFSCLFIMRVFNPICFLVASIYFGVVLHLCAVIWVNPSVQRSNY